MQRNFLSISRGSRFLIILQLCFGFSLALYFLGYPFTGKLFQSKSDLLLIESVLGRQNTLLAIDPEKAALLEPKASIQRSLFESLPKNEQLRIQEFHDSIQYSLQKPFLDKVWEGFGLLGRLPKLELLWTALAIVLPIFLLLRNPRALPFVWLFPLIALGYAWNNQVHGFHYKSVFPQDHQILVQKDATKEDWERAWRQYLVKEWGKETPSSNQEIYEKQAIKGEFFFNLARIQAISEDLSVSFWKKKSLWLLVIYVIWNAYFAYALAAKLLF